MGHLAEKQVSAISMATSLDSVILHYFHQEIVHRELQSFIHYLNTNAKVTFTESNILV